MTKALDSRYERCRAELEARGQLHVLRFWPDLDDAARSSLLDELESVPWPLLEPLIESHVLRTPEESTPGDLSPAPAFPLRPDASQESLYREASEAGRELLKAGRVAAFTVAGGQGSRLGFDGPKGALPVSPLRKKTLFQLFAEMIVAASRRYGVELPWYVMTNPANHRQTVEFLEGNDHFGLPADRVFPFVQDMLPAFDFEGRMLLADRGHLALAPSGHGGSLPSLARQGALADMRERGVDTISYFQVDNPLVKPFDPLFLGLHTLQSSEMSSKVTEKTDDFEKVGNLCLSDGRLVVIEYSDFPPELCQAKTADGRRKFDLGNLAIHLLDVGFVERIATSDMQLPFHRAEKKVAFVGDSGQVQTPAAPNAVKLEAFIFDALPLAENPLLLTIDRAEEFSPVKQAEGNDSLATATRDQVRRAARWLESAGVRVPRNAEGEPDVRLEIAPGFAMDAEELAQRIDDPEPLAPGREAYYE